MLSSVSLLVAHPTSISLIALPKPTNPASAPVPAPILSSTPLALPSRFPPNSPLYTAASTASTNASRTTPASIFVYTPSAPSVWVYDVHARRVGEMGFRKGEKVERVVGVERGVVALLRQEGRGDGGGGRERVAVMEKEKGEGRAGRWVCVRELEMPEQSGRITAIVADKAGASVAVGSDAGSLVLFDLCTDTQSVVQLGTRCTGPISPHLAFSPSLPNTLVLPSSSSSSLFRITLHPSSPTNTPDILEIRPFNNDVDSNERISAVCFSPVVETDLADGSKKTRGGLCAVLCRGEVALVGLDNPDSAAKRVTFGGETDRRLEGLVFLDGATLAARTREGKMLVKDLRALRDAPVELPLSEPATGMSVLPPSTRQPRASVAPSTTSSIRASRPNRTLSSTASNLGGSRDSRALAPTNPNIPAHSHRTAPAGVGEKPSAGGKDKSSVVGRREGEGMPRRAVSAVSAVGRKDREGGKGETGARSISGPAVASNHRLQSSALVLPTSAMPEVNAPVIDEEEGEGEVEEEGGGQPTPKACAGVGPGAREAKVVQPEAAAESWYNEPSMDLTWALRPVTAQASRAVGSTPARGMSEHEQLEELRREVGNLQMDMLRMGRGLKNEIRKAVQPLLEEVREGREVIERQMREIERLQRGH